MTIVTNITSIVCSEYDLEIVFWLHFVKLLGACTGLVKFNTGRTSLHYLLFTNKGPCMQE